MLLVDYTRSVMEVYPDLVTRPFNRHSHWVSSIDLGHGHVYGKETGRERETANVAITD